MPVWLHNIAKAINKYNKEKCDEFKIRLPKGNKEIIQNYCKDKNITVNGLMNNLLSERLSNDGYKLITRQNAPEQNQDTSEVTTDNISENTIIDP